MQFTTMMSRIGLLIVGFIILNVNVHGQNTLKDDSELTSFNQALNLFNSNNYSAARIRFEDFLRSADKSSELYIEAVYHQAYCAMQLFHQDAEQLLTEFVRRYPTHPKAMMAYFELGDFYYRKGEFKKAINGFEKVKERNLSNSKQYEYYFKLGYCYFALQDFEGALEKFRNCLKPKNNYQGASAYYTSYIEIENGNFENALEALSIAEQYEEYGSVIPVLRARALYGNRQYEKLIAYARPLLLSDQSVKERDKIELLLAEAYYGLNDYRNAYKYYDDAIDPDSKVSTEIFFRAGFCAYQSGFFDEAVSFLKKAALADNQSGQNASYYLGLSYLRLENKNYALSAMSDASRKSFDDRVKEQATYYYGKLLFDLDRYNEALDVLKAYDQFSTSENRDEVNEMISESYLHTDDVNQAIQYIESLDSRTKKVDEIYQKVTYRRATELFNAGQYFEAVQMFDRSLKYPVSKELVIDAYFWKGEAYSIGKRYENAISSYLQVFKNNPSRTSSTLLKTYYGLGYAYYNTREYQKALGNFKTYVERIPKNNQNYFLDDALLRLADCYYTTKNYSQSIAIYQRAIDAGSPEPDYCFYQIGIVSSILGDRAKAEQNFNLVINRFKNSVLYDDAMFRKAQLIFENGDYRAAIDRYTSFIKDQPQSPYLPYAIVDRAIAYSNLNQYEASISDFSRLLEEYPKHQTANNALLGLQDALSAIDRSDEFPKYLEQYKAANPEDQDLASIEFESAKNLYFSQKYEEATRAFKKYLTDYPDNPFIDDVYYYLGESRYRAEDYQGAIEYFRMVLQNTGSSWYNRALNRLALLQNMTASYGQAIKNFRRLQKLASNRREEFDVWNGLMIAYFHSDSYDSAIFFGKQILENGAFSVNATNHAQLIIGKSYYLKNDLDNALDYFLNTVNTAKDVYGAEAQYLIAEIMHKRGEYNQSNEALYNLNENFGMYERWVGQSFILIAENFIAMDELFQAKATLNSVIEKSPVDSIVVRAKQRLSELNALEKERIKEESDSIK